MKLIKIEKEIRMMRTDHPEQFKSEPAIDYKYADFNASEYVDAIKASKEYETICKEVTKRIADECPPEVKREQKKEPPIIESKKEIAKEPEEKMQVLTWDAHVKASQESKSPEDKKEEPVPPLENMEEEVKGFKYEWTPQDLEDLKDLAKKYSFDFSKIHKEFILIRPESGLKVHHLQAKWTEMESQNYRKPATDSNPLNKIE